MLAGAPFSVLVTIIITGILLAPIMLFATSCLYFLCRHYKGSALYILKTLAIGLLTLPVALLILMLAVGYLFLTIYFNAKQWSKRLYRRVTPARADKIPDGTISDEDIGASTIIIHLVHGTFETEASWTKPGSAMRQAIADKLPTAKFMRFCWSGANTPKARTLAAKELAAKIERSPSQHHYIIAHSHGGNIVREMSHTYPNIAGKVRGACLLSTPFLYRKTLSRSAGKLLSTNVFGFTFAVMLPIAVIAEIIGITDYIFLALAVPLAALLEIGLTARCRKSYANEAESEAENDSVNYRRVAIFHAIGDEADSALRFASFAHESCFGVLAQLNAASREAHKNRHTPFILSYLIFILLSLYNAAVGQFDWLAVFLIGAISVGLTHLYTVIKKKQEMANILITAALPINIFSFWLAAAKALAYGDWRLIFCPEMFVSSSETPTGSHVIEKLAPASDAEMVHSTHSHPEAVLNVAHWLADCVTPVRCQHEIDCDRCGETLRHSR
ncbi:TPA: hypothetical protein I9Y23_004340 [Kluyvera ascorbata]|uniref:DUF676 domain-containing protein n=1 Tax=Kluyvera genomosp. 2 TaxID=2774054 RepID=A0A2T2XWU7_9ENTR|nr:MULTISPECIES: hypothetical protein [Enterobacteriaceae]HAT3920647.1 hypothetical protein [Kluyvera ascorbata]PSR44746.1 hypothetical protein C8256_21540 [Kluyvera genomosp. 2]BBQ83561.1 hypothetical protein WP3W18E02_20900 [Klebsiella sp. WP3-W18-ESBL-02]BBR20584.1 hypothetical protein WP3S18E05_20640 [Klebsiella sp. WP3-S18-ESBL-05]HAT3945783.1 hypothetical protein [Kluyvera ascorbata]